MQRDHLLVAEMNGAAERILDLVGDRTPSESWSDPIRLRNRILHGYWSIDMDVLVATATDDLPGFAEQLSAIETGFDEV